METCVRGFSFMSDSKHELADLQFIEGGELERAWRSSRRERVKQREQKIWDEFVKEKDIVKNVYNDDPYQFLDQLPESCLKELMERELQKLKKETDEEQTKTQDTSEVSNLLNKDIVYEKGNGDSSHGDEHPCVTFEDEVDKDDGELFHIFDDEPSGAEEDVMNESFSPMTVRVNPLEENPQSDDVPIEPPTSGVDIPPSANKSSENVTNVVESSIYCAKVKDLRMKINDEVIAIMAHLERREILSVDPEDISRMIKRSAEYCTRFNRIYMYELQRQMHDIKRNMTNNVTLPFAKHTHFQSQMVRVVSLHQSLLQAFQAVYKMARSAFLLRGGAGALEALLGDARDATELCARLPTPADLRAALACLYSDKLLESCDKLENMVKEYSIKCEDYLKTLEGMTGSPKKTIIHKGGKEKNKGKWIKSTPKTVHMETDRRLSMYSMETLRLNFNVKSTSSKDSQLSHCASKKTLSSSSKSSKRGQTDKNSEPPKSQRKSPKQSRRPLMRAPECVRPRARLARDTDVPTMVEAVEPSACGVSGPPSAACSPRAAPALCTHTARASNALPAVKKIQTPRHLNESKDMMVSPRPNPSHLQKPVLSSIRSDKDTGVDAQASPLRNIKCAMKKDSEEEKLQQSHQEPREKQEDREEKKETERFKVSSISPDRYEVTRVLKQLCSGDASGADKVTGAKNAQLLYVNGNSPRQPSTPQLLRILEETIQKKTPKLLHKPMAHGPERYRLTFNIAEQTADAMFQYRTKFVQHMLTSALYANSAVGKPWEMIESISEQIIDEVLLSCTKEMELRELMLALYQNETK